jgi:hypothetical protein
MSDEQDFVNLLPKLRAIPLNAVRRPDMPVEQAINEGGIMAKAAQEDGELLNGVNVSTGTITELASSVNALRHAQALFTAAIGELKDSSRKWAEEEPKAFKLRADLLAAFTYALRDVPNARRALKAIREGSGNPDMLKDLSALAALGKNYLEELKAINFDCSMLDTTAARAAELNDLYQEAFIEKKTVEHRELRDRAFTCMRQLMGEILDAAEYVLRDNPQRLDLYHSSYRSRRSSKSAEPVTEDAEVPAMAEAPVA